MRLIVYMTRRIEVFSSHLHCLRSFDYAVDYYYCCCYHYYDGGGYDDDDDVGANGEMSKVVIT